MEPREAEDTRAKGEWQRGNFRGAGGREEERQLQGEIGKDRGERERDRDHGHRQTLSVAGGAGQRDANKEQREHKRQRAGDLHEAWQRGEHKRRSRAQRGPRPTPVQCGRAGVPGITGHQGNAQSPTGMPPPASPMLRGPGSQFYLNPGLT